jgi:hypothetical protein
VDIFNHYFGTILVWFHKPVETTDTEGLKQTVTGYYINLGVSAISEAQARDLITEQIQDGAVDWEGSELADADWSSLDPLIRKNFERSDKDGIWYKSGRVCFPDKE